MKARIIIGDEEKIADLDNPYVVASIQIFLGWVREHLPYALKKHRRICIELVEGE